MCDDYVLHDSVIDELKVIGAKCSLEVNKTGSLTFQIAPTHPYYDKIKKHTSEIKLYQDDRVLFCGRVLNDEITFDNIKNVECEGELSYLIDSIQRATDYAYGGKDALERYLKSIISVHNSQVDESKHFSVGAVHISDKINEINVTLNYEDTLTVLTNTLLNSYGGYLQVRHNNGVRYLDYVSELTNVCNQTIEFGKNIIDMTRYIKGEDIYTALIPLGSKIEHPETVVGTSEKRLTIKSLEDSTDGTIKKVSDYIYDTEAVKQWGWIWKVIKWDDVTVAKNLLSKAKDKLRNSIYAMLSIELTAIDLHLLDVDIDSISVGDRIRCISIPHNLDSILIVKSISIDLDNPANTKITLVSPSVKIKSDKTITSNNKDNDKNIKNIKNDLNESYPTYNDVNNKLDNYDNNLKKWIGDNYIPKSGSGGIDLSEYAKIVDVNTAFSELATALEGV